MNTYLLEWNPDDYPWDKVEADREAAHQSGSGAIRWDVGGNRHPRPGDRVFMMRVQTDQGIIGAGWIKSLPEDDRHWREDKAAQGKTYTFVMVAFAQLFVQPRITVDELRRPPFPDTWRTPRRSGWLIPEPLATALENRWLEVTGEASLLENELEEVRAQKDKEGNLTPYDLKDARTRIFAAIVLRQGQGEFRKGLLVAYQRTCAVTGCDIVEALEAAHIVPYLGTETNCVANGLLLRADIHTLFDLGLLAVNPVDYRVLISKRLKGSPYETFDGHQIRLPADKASRPSDQAFKARLAEFQCKQAAWCEA